MPFLLLYAMSFPKYLRDSKMFECYKHYRNCQQLNKPFIKAKVNPKHGNYLINIDLMTCDYNFSSDELIELKKLADIEKKVNLDSYSIDEELAWFDGVIPENVDLLCNTLYDLTQKHNS